MKKWTRGTIFWIALRVAGAAGNKRLASYVRIFNSDELRCLGMESGLISSRNGIQTDREAN